MYSAVLKVVWLLLRSLVSLVVVYNCSHALYLIILPTCELLCLSKRHKHNISAHGAQVFLKMCSCSALILDTVIMFVVIWLRPGQDNKAGTCASVMFDRQLKQCSYHSKHSCSIRTLSAGIAKKNCFLPPYHFT